MNEDREHPITGDRVAEIRARQAHSDKYYGFNQQSEVEQDRAHLLAEVAALRGRLAAVEAVADELEAPNADDPSIYGMATKSAGARLRAALATGETK